MVVLVILRSLFIAECTDFLLLEHKVEKIVKCRDDNDPKTILSTMS